MKKSELKEIIKECINEADSGFAKSNGARRRAKGKEQTNNSNLTSPSPQEIVRKLEKARTLVIDAHHISSPNDKTGLSKGLSDVWKKINDLITIANKG